MSLALVSMLPKSPQPSCSCTVTESFTGEPTQQHPKLIKSHFELNEKVIYTPYGKPENMMDYLKKLKNIRELNSFFVFVSQGSEAG